MSPRAVRSQIAAGQEAVFRYGQRLRTWADQSSPCHPRLWCFLVGPVFLTTVLLASTVNIFWKNSFDHSLNRQQEADNSILNNFNDSSTAILTHMANQLQSSTAESAVDRVSRYTRQPELVVRINKDAFKPLLPLPQSESINIIFKRLWLETTKLFPEVDYIYYGDKFGAFVGYERLPLKFAEEFNFTGVFGAEFRAPDGSGAVKLCEMCPPAFAVRPGAKTYYFVNDEGIYLQSYKEHAYDPRERPWYQAAAAGKGELVWLDIYNHSSGHTLGMTAAMALMAGSEVAAVVAADFTVSYFSDYLKYVTDVIEDEEGFILNWETGLMVASSLGISHVAKAIDSGHRTAQVRYHWTQVSDTTVQSSIRTESLCCPNSGTLLHLYGSLENLPANGTETSDDGRFLFTFSQGEAASFQATQHWLVVVTCPVKSFMQLSWKQQAWAAAHSSEVHDELQKSLARQEVLTIWTCAAFAFLGAVIMACIGFAVTQPLKKISLDMLSLAKLEFLPERHDKGDRHDRHLTGSMRRSIANRRNSISFISIAGISRLMSNLVGNKSTGSDSERSEDSSEDSSDSPNSDSDQELDLESSGRCWNHAIPREVVNMRESFLYMVTGLKSFARYMDPEIMRILVKSRRQAQLGMGRADVTVFFSDIANFTTIAESLEPETFMSMLSEYLDEMSKIIMAKRGVVGEFIGDAIMAWWNVPIDLGQEHTAMALDAALCQQLRLQELRNIWEAKSLPEVRVRMGLVRGTVLAGNIGSSQRMKYGLVGDSVNLASRLEGLCKYYGVSVIIEQEAAFAPAVQSRFHLRLLDLVTVKGRTQATELYQLLAEKGDLPDEFDAEEDLQYFIGGFAEIHRLYRSKSFSACAEALKQYRQQFPQDTPSKMLLRRVETLLNEGLPADWDAVHKLTEK